VVKADEAERERLENLKAGSDVRHRAAHLLFLIICGSVADPGCLFRIPDPDFYPFRIPNPKTATKERGKKNLLSTLFL
jgi:hypothetical protein